MSAYAECRHPRWRSRRQHVRERRGHARRRRHARRARRRRRRRAPLGLHPVEGADRHRRRAGSSSRRAHSMGIAAEGRLDIDALRERVAVDRGPPAPVDPEGPRVAERAGHQRHGALQGPARDRGRDHRAGSRRSTADFVLVATGSRPRIPDFVTVDRERVLTTRDAYPPPEIPEHAIVIGSGVTGVEFTHMFDSLGSQGHAARVAPAGAADQGRRSRRGARGGVPRRAASRCSRARAPSAIDARRRRRARALRRRSRRRGLARAARGRARSPTAKDLGLDVAGVEVDDRGYIRVNHNCLSNVAAHLRGGRRVGEAAAVVGGGDAGPQDRRAPHGPAQPPPPPPRLRQGGVGRLHRSRDRRRRAGRGRGVLRGPQDPGHQGAVLGERQGADQGRRRAAS